MCGVVLVLATCFAVFELGASSVNGTEFGCISGVISSITFKISSSVIDHVASVTCTGPAGNQTTNSPAESAGATGPYSNCSAPNGSGFTTAVAAASTNATAYITALGMSAGGVPVCSNLGSQGSVRTRKLIVSAGSSTQGGCSGSTRIIGLRNKVDTFTTALGFVCAGEP